MSKKRLKDELKLKVEYWPIAKLTPYENNSRTHSEEQVEQLVASIREFGFVNPILVATDSGILAGHGRLMAANVLGLAEVPVIVLDHFSEAQRRAFVIADNKISMNSGWDLDLLKDEVDALELESFDLELLGFDLSELEEITVGALQPKRRRGRSSIPRLPFSPSTPTPMPEPSAKPELKFNEPEHAVTKLPPGPEPMKMKGTIPQKDPAELIECPNCCHRFPPKIGVK